MKVTKIITYTNGKQESQSMEVHSTKDMSKVIAAFYTATEALKHKDKIRSINFNLVHPTNKTGKEVK
jgi:hypothetical protein